MKGKNYLDTIQYQANSLKALTTKGQSKRNMEGNKNIKM